jgi:carbonic anhydrase
MGDEFFFQTRSHNTFSGLYYAFLNPQPGAVVISVFSLALLFIFERPFMKRFGLFRFLPGALFVVLSGVFINRLFLAFLPEFHLSGKHLVNLPVAGSFDELLSFLRFPDFSAFANPKLYEIAFTLAVVASLETLLSVEATDKLDPQKRNTPTDRELKAQGVGNILSGLLGGLPITQVVVRSSANVESGGKTKMAAVIHGVVLLLTALFIPTLLNLIPLASLAAILLMVGYKLSKLSLYRSMFRLGWNQFIPFAVTITAVLFTDLLRGIGLGMLTALVYILLRNYRTTYMVSVIEEDGIKKTLLKFPEEVTFLNKASIQANLYQIPENSHLVIDGRASRFIHYDVLEIIQEFKTVRAPLRRITIETRGIPEVEVMGH